MVRLETGCHELCAQVDIPGSIHTAITPLRRSDLKKVRFMALKKNFDTGSRAEQQISWSNLIN